MADDTRQRAVEALMALAAERDFSRIEMRDIAERSGLTMAALREAFDDPLDVLAAFSRDVDGKVLAATGDDMDEEPARERLFDVLMTRFDLLKAHRPALRSVMGGLTRDPFALARWNRTALASAAWMLGAAKIDTTGFLGRVRAQGLVLAWGRAFAVFLRDEDEGLARTMAELDRRLRDGERWMGTVSRLGAMDCARSRRRRREERRPGEDYERAPA